MPATAEEAAARQPPAVGKRRGSEERAEAIRRLPDTGPPLLAAPAKVSRRR